MRTKRIRNCHRICYKFHFMLSASLKFLALTFCPLLLALCLFSVPACKKPTEPKAALPDTTSHDFVFEINTLGSGSSSVLNDVWIFDENNIWAVGEIYVQDSSGQAEEVYNAVHWDGTRWNLVRVPTLIWNTTSIIYAPLNAIIAFSANEICVTTGGQIIWYNGSYWGRWKFLFDDLNDSTFGGINKFWGTSSTNIWGGGNKGNIFHYDGSTWQKLASGTTVDIQDIWGAVEEKTKQKTILAIASFLNYGRGLDLLKIDGTDVTKLDTSGLPFSLNSIWFDLSKRFYVTGNGVYSKANLAEARWQSDDTHPQLYKDRIRGARWNDVFIAGSGGLVSHFNGATWRHYTGTELPYLHARYQGLDVEGNVVVAVGWANSQAIVVRGKR